MSRRRRKVSTLPDISDIGTHEAKLEEGSGLSLPEPSSDEAVTLEPVEVPPLPAAPPEYTDSDRRQNLRRVFLDQSQNLSALVYVLESVESNGEGTDLEARLLLEAKAVLALLSACTAENV